MSTHFVTGDRKMIQGRFAENNKEVNISEDLAKLNNLNIGDYIEIYLFPLVPTHYTFKVVGIFSDDTAEVSRELDLVEGRRLGTDRLITWAGRNGISRHHLLTAAEAAAMGYFSIGQSEASGIVRGHHVLVYYVESEHDITLFTEYVYDTLHERFEAVCSFSNNPDDMGIVDSANAIRIVRYLSNRTANAMAWFLFIAGTFCVIFILLTMFYLLKQRTYDIGVFRARGMTRLRLAFLFSMDFFMVSVLSFVVATALYITTFVPLTRFIYYTQYLIGSNTTDGFLYHNFDFNFLNAFTEYELVFTASPFHLFLGFASVVAFTAIMAFVIALYIAHHEPMKTMVAY
jgi:hypothetical protein